MTEFRKFGSITRLFRDVVVTEKIDGTNASVIVEEYTGQAKEDHPFSTFADVDLDGPPPLLVTAQSRNRIIGWTKETDNHGFGAWVHDNARALAELLGPGYHYGEWWGQGIQRGYGLSAKRFSLFNTAKWDRDVIETASLKFNMQIDVVPVLYRGVFDQLELDKLAAYLTDHGSIASPGFKPAEGIVIWHKPSGTLFKYTLDGDGHKSA